MNLSGLLGNSYVTGVLNDYSIVEKATFTLVKPDSSFKKATCETVPVQINPSDLVYQYSSPVRTIFSGLSDTNGGTSSDTSYGSSASLSMTLYYDFYDEYQARTASGAMSFLSSFNLMEEKFSSLKKLTDHANENPMPLVLFRWGDSINFFGVLENISPSYRAFSQWGHPLKAEASINIYEDKNHENLRTVANDYATGSGTFSKLTNTALLGAGLALR